MTKLDYFFSMLPVVAVLLLFCFTKYIDKERNKVEDNSTSKIEEVKTKNDTLIIKLDSIKNEKYIKVEEAKAANDSTTLELWYKLVRE